MVTVNRALAGVAGGPQEAKFEVMNHDH